MVVRSPVWDLGPRPWNIRAIAKWCICGIPTTWSLCNECKGQRECWEKLTLQHTTQWKRKGCFFEWLETVSVSHQIGNTFYSEISDQNLRWEEWTPQPTSKVPNWRPGNLTIGVIEQLWFFKTDSPPPQALVLMVQMFLHVRFDLKQYAFSN